MPFSVDRYWNRITYTDYNQFAVEMHCSLPWFRQQMVIYTRMEYPKPYILGLVKKYLISVKVSMEEFFLVNKATCKKNSTEPIQHWHLSKYLHMGYHSHYVMPLVIDANI